MMGLDKRFDIVNLVARLAIGGSLPDAVRYANVAAAISTTGYGAIAPIPHQADVLIKLANKLAEQITEATT